MLATPQCITAEESDAASLDRLMNQDPRFTFPGVVCLLVWPSILRLGLWPFDFFPGKSKWLQNSNGVHFDRHGEA
jgi:hypothetical protein